MFMNYNQKILVYKISVWGLKTFDKFIAKFSTFLNWGFLDRLKERPSEMIRSKIASIRRVSLEVVIFCVLWSPIKILNLFEGWFYCCQVMCYSLFWRRMYLMMLWDFISTYPWSYAEYFTLQLLITHPVSMKWKISYCANNK